MSSRIELYQRTIGILKIAFIKNTLVNNNACACAGGHLVAAALGYDIRMVEEYKYDTNQIGYYWFENGIQLPYPSRNEQQVPVGWFGLYSISGASFNDFYKGEVKKQVEATGYTYLELLRIEEAFESHIGNNPEELIFYGLLNVLDVLGEIHELSDHEIIAEKESFAWIRKSKNNQHQPGPHQYDHVA